MNQFFGILALCGLTLSALAHIAALLGVDVKKEVPAVLGLHIGIFVVLLPYFWQNRKTLRPRPSLAQLRQQYPAWVFWVGAVLFAYTLVNFLMLFVNTEGGSTAVRDGKYILHSHGHFIRELSASEYKRFQANVIRGFSGHWMAFYFTGCAWYLWRKKVD